jgi:hypothetical protein
VSTKVLFFVAANRVTLGTPGKGREANWLPVPKDKFALVLRRYWPKEKPPSIIDGTWKVPPVRKAS